MSAIAATGSADLTLAGSRAVDATPARAAVRDISRRAAASLRYWLGMGRTEVAPMRVNRSSRSEMSLEAQWRNVATVIERAIRRGQSAVELHAAAALRIDSTEYEIGLLKQDLASVLIGQRGAKA